MEPENLNVLQVLLVEDEPLIRLLARRSLEKLGCMVVEASTCAEAERLWSDGHPDLVVLDYRLPDGFGKRLLETMRAHHRAEPAVYMCGEPEAINEDHVRNCGVVGVLAKPMELDALASMIERVRAARDAKEKTPTAMTRAGDEQEDQAMVGRFLVVPCPAKVTRDFIRGVRTDYASESWLALNMQETQHIEPAALKELIHLANHCRVAGGRFCLAGLSHDRIQHLNRLRFNHEVNMVGDLEALESVGRRLSSPSERLAVLEAAVDKRCEG